MLGKFVILQLNDEKSKMINSSRDKDFEAKKGSVTDDRKLGKSATTTTSRQWAGFKNPRIVRVSRSFGGKDRHSKVCTIRGLRDRRIRLSVPTAVQLYDLQDRLGLDQPSKVVDWLLDATKHDIDKLPPLQMPPGGDFSQFYQPTLGYPHDLNAPQYNSLSPFFNINSEFMKDGGSHQLFNKGIRINDRDGDDDQTVAGKAKYWINPDSDPRAKCQVAERDRQNINAENNKWNITTSYHQQENQVGNSNGGYISQLSAQNFFPLANHFSFPSLLNNTNMSSYNWDPSNLSSSQFGGQLGFPSQGENSQSTTHNAVSFSSSLALNPSTSQLFFRPPATTPSFFSPYMASSIESDPRQISHFQLLSSSSQHSPLRFVNPSKVNPQNNNDSQLNKGN